MPARLKDRQHQIPNGFSFALPELNWQSQSFQSFDSIVNSVQQLIQANDKMAREKGWPYTRETIADWVDAYNASVCQFNGWNDYFTGTAEVGPPPKSTPLSSAQNVVAGAKTLADWIGSGAEPVSREQATARAAICVKCPVMAKGDLGNFFTRAAAEIIRMQIETAQDLELNTKYDKELGVCSACSCPMRLKVFVSLKPILNNIPPESKSKLHSSCWIMAEELTETLGTIVPKTP